MKYTALALFFLLKSYYCLAQPSKLIYSDVRQLVEIGENAGYFIDSTNELSPHEIAKLSDSKFLSIPDKIINLGFSPSRIWFKFNIQNRTDEPLYALFLAQDIDYIDACIVSEDTTYYVETGALRPFERRYFSLNSVVLNLGKRPEYLYVGLKDMNGLVSQIELGTIRPLVNRIYRETLINAFVMGVMLLIILFSFFMYFTLKERTYLLYALHVVFSTLTFLSFEGYLFDFLWREMPYMNNGINASLIRLSALLTSIGFSVAFLNIKNVLPQLYRLFQGLGALALLVVFAKLIGIQKAEMVFNIVVLITFLSYLIVGFWLYRRGFRPARFYLLGWGFYILEILLIVLTLFNVISFDHIFTYTKSLLKCRIF